MIPMVLTPDRYADVFNPAPEYIIVQKLVVRDDAIGGVVKPLEVVRMQAQYTHIAKLLAISNWPCEFEWLNEYKRLIKERNAKYVCFPGHVVGDVVIPEKYRLPFELEGLVIQIHLRDITQIPETDKYEALEAEWLIYQKEQLELNKLSLDSIQKERDSLREEENAKEYLFNSGKDPS